MRAIVIPRDVTLDANLSGDAKVLYGHLLALSYRDGFCFATNQWFARTFGKHERTVKRWIAELVDHELIRVVDGNSKRRQIFPAIDEKGQPLPPPRAARGNRASSVPVESNSADTSGPVDEDETDSVNGDTSGPVGPVTSADASRGACAHANRATSVPSTGTHLSKQPGQICPPSDVYRETSLLREDARADAHAAPPPAEPLRTAFGDAMEIAPIVLDAFRTAMAGTAAVMPKTITTGTLQSLALRANTLRLDGIEPDAEYWARLFKHLAGSDWLSGRKRRGDGQPHRLRLDWLLREDNFEAARSHAYCDAGQCPHVVSPASRGAA